jgi:hypothetical protein
MQQVLVILFLRLGYLAGLICIVSLLSACGGGGKSTGSNFVTQTTTSSSSSSNTQSSLVSLPLSSSSSSLSMSTSSVASVPDTVTLSGVITYDFVPHNINYIGLNYSATESRPVRGAIVELLNNLEQIEASVITTETGSYSFNVAKNSILKIRVKAQLLRSTLPSWNFKVTDNTANNALYVLDGSLISVGSNDSIRNLHASSGWDGLSYSGTRSAAPFAILDDVYIAAQRTLDAGNKKNLSPLELRWSTKNSVADGDYTKGEIGTSFYDGSAIYILGDANNDIDEYDRHVLLHEWGHYLEAELFRSDSIGGDHSDGELLDFRVAMSEGFANAFSGMMIDDINYADASGTGESSGFTFNIGKKNRSNKGFFSEGSVGSVMINYYTSSLNKIANDFTPIFNILSSSLYTSSDALTSIFLFNAQLSNQKPDQASLFGSLLHEQNIFGVDEYGTDESNNGGLSITLPVYKILSANNTAVNVCSSADYGKQNKLGNSQFLKLNITQAGSYNIRINKSGGVDVTSKPEFILYQKGKVISYGVNTLTDSVVNSVTLLHGNYVLEVYDNNNHDSKNTDKNTTCFNVRVAAN